ncbi:MAG TPA: molybdate ABC transporter substrate-binding protein [Actinocrinis sp.]|nr:molybdate ABC transporter substrate-binding protein [Actinocrinis sp.]
MRSTNKSRWIAAPLAVAAAFALASCSSSSTPAAAGTPAAASAGASSAGPALSGTVTVLAASSLQAAFTTLGKQFEAAHPGVTVKFSFAGSGTLATQITGGAPADVFAAASPGSMATLTKASDTAAAPVTFTRNQLEIATAPGNPLDISSLADLAKPGVKVSLCAATEPCGAASQQVLTTAGVKVTPVTLAADDTADVTAIESGQVDASLVYHSDVLTAGGKVTGVQFPESASAILSYPIAVLKNAPDPTAAQAFVAYILSSDGSAVLTAAGFLAP